MTEANEQRDRDRYEAWQREQEMGAPPGVHMSEVTMPHIPRRRRAPSVSSSAMNSSNPLNTPPANTVVLNGQSSLHIPSKIYNPLAARVQMVGNETANPVAAAAATTGSNGDSFPFVQQPQNVTGPASHIPVEPADGDVRPNDMPAHRAEPRASDNRPPPDVPPQDREMETGPDLNQPLPQMVAQALSPEQLADYNQAMQAGNEPRAMQILMAALGTVGTTAATIWASLNGENPSTVAPPQAVPLGPGNSPLVRNPVFGPQNRPQPPGANNTTQVPRARINPNPPNGGTSDAPSPGTQDRPNIDGATPEQNAWLGKIFGFLGTIFSAGTVKKIWNWFTSLGAPASLALALGAWTMLQQYGWVAALVYCGWHFCSWAGVQVGNFLNHLYRVREIRASTEGTVKVTQAQTEGQYKLNQQKYAAEQQARIDRFRDAVETRPAKRLRKAEILPEIQRYLSDELRGSDEMMRTMQDEYDMVMQKYNELKKKKIEAEATYDEYMRSNNPVKFLKRFMSTDGLLNLFVSTEHMDKIQAQSRMDIIADARLMLNTLLGEYAQKLKKARWNGDLEMVEDLQRRLYHEFMARRETIGQQLGFGFIPKKRKRRNDRTSHK